MYRVIIQEKYLENFFGYKIVAKKNFHRVKWLSIIIPKIYCFYNVVKIEHYYSFSCQSFILHVDFDLRNSIQSQNVTDLRILR